MGDGWLSKSRERFQLFLRKREKLSNRVKEYSCFSEREKSPAVLSYEAEIGVPWLKEHESMPRLKLEIESGLENLPPSLPKRKFNRLTDKKLATLLTVTIELRRRVGFPIHRYRPCLVRTSILDLLCFRCFFLLRDSLPYTCFTLSLMYVFRDIILVIKYQVCSNSVVGWALKLRLLNSTSN